MFDTIAQELIGLLSISFIILLFDFLIRLRCDLVLQATTAGCSTPLLPPLSAWPTLTGATTSRCKTSHFITPLPNHSHSCNDIDAGVGQHAAHDVRGGPRRTGKCIQIVHPRTPCSLNNVTRFADERQAAAIKAGWACCHTQRTRLARRCAHRRGDVAHINQLKRSMHTIVLVIFNE